MMYTKRLWRRFSPIIHTDLRSIPIPSPYLHSQVHPLSHLSSPSSPRNSAKPRFPVNVPLNFSEQLWRKFCSESSVRRCWNCNSSPQSETFLVCGSCNCIQPVDSSIDYFQIFGLERKYDIEEGGLEGKYKAWQKKLHPDLVHSKSESEREYAAEQSARVIDAYKTLGNSLSRAIYLMKLQGVHVGEEQTVSDPELLDEVQEKTKEWSESVASAFKSRDTKEALNAIRRMTYYKRASKEIIKRL